MSRDRSGAAACQQQKRRIRNECTDPSWFSRPLFVRHFLRKHVVLRPSFGMRLFSLPAASVSGRPSGAMVFPAVAGKLIRQGAHVNRMSKIENRMSKIRVSWAPRVVCLVWCVSCGCSAVPYRSAALKTAVHNWHGFLPADRAMRNLCELKLRDCGPLSSGPLSSGPLSSGPAGLRHVLSEATIALAPNFAPQIRQTVLQVNSGPGQD